MSFGRQIVFFDEDPLPKVNMDSAKEQLWKMVFLMPNIPKSVDSGIEEVVKYIQQDMGNHGLLSARALVLANSDWINIHTLKYYSVLYNIPLHIQSMRELRFMHFINSVPGNYHYIITGPLHAHSFAFSHGELEKYTGAKRFMRELVVNKYFNGSVRIFESSIGEQISVYCDKGVKISEDRFFWGRL